MDIVEPDNLIIPDSPSARVESPRQEPCHERILQSDQDTAYTLEIPRQDVQEAHINVPEMISPEDALLGPCEREIVKLLAEAIDTSKVRQDTSTKRQEVPCEGTETTLPVAANEGACPSQYSGPFIPHPRHYSKSHPTDVVPEEGSLFNPTAFSSRSERVWLNDACLNGVRMWHNAIRPGSDSTDRSSWEGVQGMLKVFEIVLGHPALIPPSVSGRPFDLPPF